jgi:hypothetical protein
LPANEVVVTSAAILTLVLSPSTRPWGDACVGLQSYAGIGPLSCPVAPPWSIV